MYNNSLKIELFFLEIHSKSPSFDSSHIPSILKIFEIINKELFSSAEDEMRYSAMGILFKKNERN